MSEKWNWFLKSYLQAKKNAYDCAKSHEKAEEASKSSKAKEKDINKVGSTQKWAAKWQNQQSDLHPAKTQISLGIGPVWTVFAVCMKKAWVLSYPLSAQRRLWSELADAKADLSLRWAHSHFVDFVMLGLK